MTQNMEEILELDPTYSGSIAQTTNPHVMLLRIGMALLISYYDDIDDGHPPTNLVDKKQLEAYDSRILDRVFNASVKDPDVREALATDIQFWNDLTRLIHMAIPYLSSRCFDSSIPESEPGYDSFSCKRIVARHDVLVEALLRLEKCVKIGKNALVHGPVAQNNAARARTDAAAYEVVTLCIKVTARGFADAEEDNSEDEEKWQVVTDVFKRLLGGALQFLNNLVVRNENRKTSMWVELFESEVQGQSLLSSDGLAEVARSLANKAFDDLGSESEDVDAEKIEAGAEATRYPLFHPFLLYFVQMSSDVRIRRAAKGDPADLLTITEELMQQWDKQNEAERELWTSAYKAIQGRETIATARPTVSTVIRAVDQNIQQRLKHISLDQILKPSILRVGNGVDSTPALYSEPNTTAGTVSLDLREVLADFGVPQGAVAEENDYTMTYDASYGEDLLRKGKNELLKRLEPDTARSSVNLGHQAMQQPAIQSPSQEAIEQSISPTESQSNAPPQREDEEEEEEDDADSEDDYIVPGDNGRGLLTDVPLILGPGEIEVLPMIIQTGIVAPTAAQLPPGITPEDVRRIHNLYYVRCHLLLAQENGRNLFRELLIFVAAWDLRDDELYFKLMANIMQAILLSGLLPFSYSSFREPKDIVSPAQAVIMKLLTNIFRKRQAEHAHAKRNPGTTEMTSQGYPQKVEVQMVRTLLEEFRRIIIPQVCAIVFCQGQIRGGHASADDFPLNLWDMERMYEGIYQYLEFFAILTEHNTWKAMMTQWEITTELVTLIEELDMAIPRSTAKSQSQAKTGAAPAPTDTTTSATSRTPEQTHDPRQEASQNLPQTQNQGPPTVPARVPPNSLDNYPPGPIEDEPSAFEWRNLKKLAVLVLSSLVWQNPRAQTQLGVADKQGRPGRGLRALLACCRSDDFNPYVREHAVLAIRFSLEGNEGNQKIFGELCRKSATGDVQGMQGQDVPRPEHSASGAPDENQGDGWQEKVFFNGVEVPKEILDLNGYEIYTDENGERRLRKRARPATAP